ncbi:MAG: rhodanese-related sulfurtransferase [Candidatus Babeliales bacterium]
MSKILLFYKYISLENPEAIKKWQRTLCDSLELKGRILIGKEGINATIGGSLAALETYKQAMNSHELFGGIDWKEAAGSAIHFPRMRIVVRKEIVALGIDPETLTPAQGGAHLTPAQTHNLINNRKELVLLDARNNYESAVGTFRNALTPDIKNFRDLPQWIEQHIDQFKDKEVLMFCTGGIRCERATSVLKIKNVAKEVYQIQGGIHRYIEQYPDGHFRGKNYVFDGRIAVKANEDVLGRCHICQKKEDTYTNCLNVLCNRHFICCDPCLGTMSNTCNTTCQELVKTQKVKVRGQLRPMYAE